MEPLEINGVAKQWIRDPHREGRLRRAGHVHAREREVGVQGRPPAAAAGAALDHVPLSRGLSRRPARARVQRLPVHGRHRGRAHRVHDLPAVLGQARRVAGAVPRLRRASRRTRRSGSTSSSRRSSGSARCRPTRPRSRPPSSTKYETMRRLAWEGGQRVVWEYWDGREWEPLAVDDETRGFTELGLRVLRRARRLADVVASSPRSASGCARGSSRAATSSRRASGMIVTNAIDAFNHETDPRRDARRLRRLAAAAVQVPARPAARGRGHRGARAADARTPEEIADLGPDAVRPVEPDNPQNNEVLGPLASASTASSRRDRAAATTRSTTSPARVTFGDGRRGMVPPEAQELDRRDAYRIGGGALGNVNAEHADVARPRARVHRER